MSNLGKAAPMLMPNVPVATKEDDVVQITVQNSDLEKLYKGLNKKKIAHIKKCMNGNNRIMSVIRVNMAEDWFIKAMFKFDLGRRDYFVIQETLNGDPDIHKMVITDPAQLEYAINKLGKNGQLNAEIFLNGRWYPIHLDAEYETGMFGTYTTLSTPLHIVNIDYTRRWYVTDRHFNDSNGRSASYTVEKILDMVGLRMFQTNIEEYRARCLKAIDNYGPAGTVKECVGPALNLGGFMFWTMLDSIELGDKTSPRRVILERQLETKHEIDDDPEDVIPNRPMEQNLPFIRVFAIDHKAYMYVDVDDLRPGTFDVKAVERLVLPDEKAKLLKSLFTADTSSLFGDMLKGKHGGMIILANGRPGTGKTLTAEVFAEYTKRPLYAVAVGELGLDLESIERNLQRIFRRVTKWNAVLLLDEADIFLAKRDENIERSAIVGVFLRLLDYYKGLLFLTTNRVETIDEAFRSRITIKLTYPDLEKEARLKIWTMMLKQAEVPVNESLGPVADMPMNGRQIRNMVRLIKVLHKGKPVVPVKEILEVCKFSND